MGLQDDWPFAQQSLLAIPEVLHDCIIDNKLAVEPDPGSFTDLLDVKTVPFAEGFVSIHKGVFALGFGAVVPEASGTLVSTDVELTLRWRSQICT